MIGLLINFPLNTWDIDILSKEIPHGLPPIRGIKYQIDFILGKIWRNKRKSKRKSPNSWTIELNWDYGALVGGLFGLLILLPKPIFLDTFEHVKLGSQNHLSGD
ncbi:hypothetical protein CR513_20372, partial [Mucuna pruriens]